MAVFLSEYRVVLPGGVYDAAGLHALLCEGRSLLQPDGSHPAMTFPERAPGHATRLARQALADAVPDALVVGTTKGELEPWLEDRTRPQGPGALLSGLGCDARIVRAVSTACASGAQAVIDAAELVQDGDATDAVALGVDALTPFVTQGFASLQALSADGARPFDRERDGLSLGEAAAAVRLRAQGGGARLVGWGGSNDANHISGPSRDGSGLALAIRRALAGHDPASVVAICAHGTGTRYNDAMEAKAFRAVFGTPPPVFGIKGALGHTLGACGVIELIAASEVARTGIAPPTARCRNPAPDCELDVVRGEARDVGRGLVLSTNSGFGGINTALLVDWGAA
jgi:hypothetical protein